jgi:hypothetical protein
VTFIATVTVNGPGQGVPTGSPNGGTLTFTVQNGAGQLTGTVAINAQGQAAFQANGLTIGNHVVTAVFTPSNTTNFGGSTGTLNQNVLNASVTTVTSSSPGNPPTSLLGTAVTLTATVRAAAGGVPVQPAPGSMVQFIIDGFVSATVPINANGQAQYTASGYSLSYHSVVAKYLGDNTNFGGSQSAQILQRVVSNTTSTLLSSGTSTVGQPVQFVATVKPSTPGAPANVSGGGGFNFYVDGVLMAGIAVNAQGVAVWQTSNLSAGNHTIVAIYTGSALFNSSSAAINQQVNGLAVSLAIGLTNTANQPINNPGTNVPFNINAVGLNSSGQPATGLFGFPATLQLLAAPAGGVLSGPTLVAFDGNGVAHFTNMTVNIAGQYTVRVTDPTDGIFQDFTFLALFAR